MTELAVIEQDVAPQELSKRDAKALDKKVRAKSDRVSKNFTTLDKTIEELGNLIQEAIDGQIHKGLGLKSWTAWVKDAVQVSVPDRFQRKELVRELSKSGMSQRAIATVFNVSQKTVDRDLDGEDVAEGATVTSLDGAQRPKNKPKDDEPEPDYIDVEAEEAPDDDTPMTAVNIVSYFDDEIANLYAAQSELSELTDEEKWPNARKRIAKANLNNLQGIITHLQAIVDDLMSEES
jgi:transposase